MYFHRTKVITIISASVTKISGRVTYFTHWSLLRKIKNPSTLKARGIEIKNQQARNFRIVLNHQLSL